VREKAMSAEDKHCKFNPGTADRLGDLDLDVF
jgi:hypothetical protein